MDRRAVQLNVAGQNYKLVSTSPEAELQRLAAKVNEKVFELVPAGRAPTANAILLAAMALAYEVEEERGRREALERRTRDLLRRALVRVDDTLERLGGDAEAE